MRNRALTRRSENKLDINVEGLSEWLSTIVIHEPRAISKAIRQIAKEGGLIVKDLRLDDDVERIDWREFGGRPARDPQALEEVERRIDDLLDCLRTARRAYVYAVNNLATDLDHHVSIEAKEK